MHAAITCMPPPDSDEFGLPDGADDEAAELLHFARLTQSVLGLRTESQ